MAMSTDLKKALDLIEGKKRNEISWERITSKLAEKEENINKKIVAMTKIDNAGFAAASKYRIN